MIYDVRIKKKAEKFIQKQPRSQRDRLYAAIYNLPNGDVKLLQGWTDVYRLRVGDYRIIYEKHDDIMLILVVDAGSRGDIYK